MLETIQKLVATVIVIATTTIGMAQTPLAITYVQSKQAVEDAITPVKTVIAEEQYKPQPLKTKSDMEEYLRVYALEKGVSYKAAHYTIECESNWDTNVQSIFVKDGKREESYGLAQINLPSHKQVTLAQAEDPEFAIKFLVDNFAAGKASLWSCWRQYHNQVK